MTPKFKFDVNSKGVSISQKVQEKRALILEGEVRGKLDFMGLTPSGAGVLPPAERLDAINTRLATAQDSLDTTQTAFLLYEKGRLLGLAKAPQDQVVDAFLPVATGEVPSTPWHRDNAAVKIAHTLRYGVDENGKLANKPDEALAAFLEVRELERFGDGLPCHHKNQPRTAKNRISFPRAHSG